jgi:hypothetical protein
MAKIKTHWEKTTPYGDYSLTKDRVNARNNRNLHIIRKGRALGVIGLHAGSKPISRIIQSIRTFEINTDLHEKAKPAKSA